MKKFPINPNNLDEAVNSALEYIHDQLNHCRLKSKVKNQAALMAEESLLKLMEHANFTENSAIFINIRRLFGNIRIILTVPGQEFDFAENLNFSLPFADEGMPEAQEAIQNILMRSFEEKLRYSHKKGLNTIRINAVTSSRASFYWTITALISAIILGVLLKSFTPESFYLALDSMILVRGKVMYMNALKTVVTPLVFFALVSCLSHFRSLEEIGKVGFKVTASFVIKMFLSSAIGVGIFYLFHPGGGVNLVPSSAAPAVTPLPQADIITSIVPSNFLRPFFEMNMLQVLFLAFLCGAGFGMLGIYTKLLRDFFEACFQLFMSLVKIVMRFMPFAAFCSILSALLEADVKVLFSLAGVFAVSLVATFCVAGMSLLQLLILGRLSPGTFLKKYFPVLLIASTSSTSGCIPNNMESCAEFGVPKQIYSFSIPLGATISLDASSMYTSFAALTLANIYDVPVPSSEILPLIATAAILAISAPGIPGAALACISVVIAQLGVTSEALGLIMGVYTLVNLINIPVNGMSAVVSTIVVASREGVLDKKAYYEPLP